MKRLIEMMVLLPMAAFALPVLVDSALKGALLMAVILLAILLLRRSSAALRHLVMAAAMLGLLLLPVLSLTLPSWRVLPAWAQTKIIEPAAEIARPELSRMRFASDFADAPAGLVVAALPATPPAAAAAATTRENSWVTLAVWVWLLGGVLLALRLALSQYALWRLGHRARPCADAGPLAVLQDLRRGLQIRREVELLVHPDRAMPMTWGIFKTRLLLPAESCDWSAGRLRAVLLHELAHVKRRDCLTQLLVQSTCAVHWFNPLVWVAARKIAAERERACDDLVLNSGVRASDYAEHLLRITTGYEDQPVVAAAALAMARKSRLEGRLTSILSDHTDRRTITRRVAMAVGACLAMLALPVAMMRAVADDDSDKQVKVKAKATEEKSLSEMAAEWARETLGAGTSSGDGETEDPIGTLLPLAPLRRPNPNSAVELRYVPNDKFEMWIGKRFLKDALTFDERFPDAPGGDSLLSAASIDVKRLDRNLFRKRARPNYGQSLREPWAEVVGEENEKPKEQKAAAADPKPERLVDPWGNEYTVHYDEDGDGEADTMLELVVPRELSSDALDDWLSKDESLLTLSKKKRGRGKLTEYRLDFATITEGDPPLAKNIRSLDLENNKAGDAVTTSAQLIQKRNELRELRDGGLGRIHPKVVELKAEIEHLEAAIDRDLPRRTETGFAGIGVTLSQTQDGELTINSLLEGGPAQKGGLLKAGDRITAVAQGFAAGDDPDLGGGARSDFVETKGMRLEDIVALLRGRAGDAVRLKIAREEDGKLVMTEIAMRRQTLKIPPVGGELVEKALQNDKKQAQEANFDFKPGVDPPDVYLNGYLDVREAEQLQAAGKLAAARAKYEKAAGMFKAVGKRWPDFEPDMVRFRLKKIAEAIDKLAAMEKEAKEAKAGEPVILRLKFADAAESKRAIDAVLRKTKRGRVIADPETNSLIYLGDEPTLKLVRSMLEWLDHAE